VQPGKKNASKKGFRVSSLQNGHGTVFPADFTVKERIVTASVGTFFLKQLGKRPPCRCFS
jgi:hypothetical protein